VVALLLQLPSQLDVLQVELVLLGYLLVQVVLVRLEAVQARVVVLVLEILVHQFQLLNSIHINTCSRCGFIVIRRVSAFLYSVSLNSSGTISKSSLLSIFLIFSGGEPTFKVGYLTAPLFWPFFNFDWFLPAPACFGAGLMGGWADLELDTGLHTLREATGIELPGAA
jgi:hypothetical protein